MHRFAAICLTLIAALAAAAPASAAKRCAEPAKEWERATPAEAGMDAAKLQEAIDYGTTQSSYAIRVYRHGCLVGEDRQAPLNRDAKYESWSMAKSVTSMVFGRAMTLRLISPDDPVGSLVTEADGPHGKITTHDLLTMTSGLRWNGFRDYNIFTMPDRVRDALTLDIVHEPGTWFEYAQSAVTLLGETVTRAAGEDMQAFAQRELMDPLGIPAGEWYWVRDKAGNVQAFYGVNMRPDDFGRLGELMRRGGKWRGEQLLSKEYVQKAVAPSRTNGCYGWLIWVNAAAPCIGPTVSERSWSDNRDQPDLPVDMYRFSGLFGQLVTVFPTQGIVMVRTGQDPGLVPAGGQGWEHELYARLLASVTDEKVTPAGDARTDDKRPEADYHFGTSLAEPDQYSKGADQDRLPPAGPARARAAILSLTSRRASAEGGVAVRVYCPPVWPTRRISECTGQARLEGARRAVRYTIEPGRNEIARFRLSAKRLRSLRRKGSLVLTASALNRDRASGTRSSRSLRVLAPKAE